MPIRIILTSEKEVLITFQHAIDSVVLPVQPRQLLLPLQRCTPPGHQVQLVRALCCIQHC